MSAQRLTFRSISLGQQLVRHRLFRQRHDVALLVAAAASVSVGFASIHMGDNGSETQQYQWTAPLARLCICEENGISPPVAASQPMADAKPTAAPNPLSRLTLMLYASKLYPHSYLRLPRLLTPRDPLFSYPELKRGLKRRQKDEEKVKQILSSTEVMEARKNQDQAKMTEILQQMNAVVYGKGITPQMREDFLMQYGCTGFTDEILQYLVANYGSRGIVEVGAGNGQWARALSDYYNEQQKQQPENNSKSAKKSWEFIVAYDNMKQLPLSPQIYHKNTLPANKYFYEKVQRSSHIDSVSRSNGRALLLVYPPPGPMAIETVQAYIKSSPGYFGSSKNDTIVYVGEGRGGANADGAFFDYFLGCDERNDDDTEACQWVLEKVMDVRTCPGGKGYEKMFVFKRK